MSRQPESPLDRLITELDTALRVLCAPAEPARPAPGTGSGEPVTGEEDRALATSLMRVNHAGEVAAQALYRGQALLARDPAVRARLLRAADEENDHLAWCERRLDELGSRPSRSNPVWYGGGFLIGAMAAAGGDRLSLGFLAETERQVAGHLAEHLQRLPEADRRSRAILEQMREEEMGHIDTAVAHGALELAAPVRGAMRLAAGVMKAVASRW